MGFPFLSLSKYKVYNSVQCLDEQYLVFLKFLISLSLKFVVSDENK